MLSWTARDLAEALNIPPKEAEQVIPVLELQGYVKPAQGKKGEWITTPAGEAVSGAKTPRYSRESIAKALTALGERIKAVNQDRQADFRVDGAVAFGDFLSKRPQVQAADVGVHLVRRNAEGHEPNSFVEQAAQRQVLQMLRGRSALLHLWLYEPWMSHRSHRKLA